MANKYPYPDAEHYTFPTTPNEVMADELRYHPDPVSFRLNIGGLGRMYEKTALLGCFQKYTALMRIVAATTGPGTPTSD